MRATSILVVVSGCLFFLLASGAGDLAAQKKKKKAPPPVPSGPISPVGRPDFTAGQAARVALWYEGDAWQLRVTSKKGVRVNFSGRIEADKGRVVGIFQDLEKAKSAAKADWVTPLPKGKGFAFQVNTTGQVDGFSFRASPEANEIAFDFRISGDDDPTRIFIGADSRHPEKTNFILPAHPLKNPLATK